MTSAESLRFFAQAGRFRCRDYARAAGISRQAALQHLHRAVDCGELVMEGVGRGTWYALPPERSWSSPPEPDPFWRKLERRAESFVHLSLVSQVGPRCRHRREVVRLLDGRDEALIALDFAGVVSVSGGFARALVDGCEDWCRETLVINAAPHVARVLDRARRLRALRPTTGYGE